MISQLVSVDSPLQNVFVLMQAVAVCTKYYLFSFTIITIIFLKHCGPLEGVLPIMADTGRLQVYKRVGISRAEVYERLGKGPLIKIFRLDNNIVFWLTS